MLDERNVSWKVFLPRNYSERVLVCGFKIDDITGLARSFSNLEWCPFNGNVSNVPLPEYLVDKVSIREFSKIIKERYDMVFVDHADSLVDASLCLNNSGILVYCGPCNARYIQRTIDNIGFEHVSKYSALPSHKPRLYIPITNNKIRQKGLSFHSPGSIRGIFGIFFLKIFSYLEILFPFLRRGVVLCAKRNNSIGESLLQWINSRLGENIANLVVYCGSDTDRRKLTLLAVGDGEDYVVKIADTSKGTQAILDEVLALQSLENIISSFMIPNVVFCEQWGEYLVQVQTLLSKSGNRQKITLTAKHKIALAELSSLNRKTCAMCDTSIWRDIVKIVIGKDSEFPAPLSSLLQEISTELFASKKVFTHRVHGDFTPWNMSFSSSGLVIWDWEDSLDEGLFFTDIFIFITRQALLVGPWPGAPEVVSDIERACMDVVIMGDFVSSADWLASLKVWIVKEYMSNPNNRLVQIIEILG